LNTLPNKFSVPIAGAGLDSGSTVAIAEKPVNNRKNISNGLIALINPELCLMNWIL